MKKDISIKELAQEIHSVALNIRPCELSKLLCLLDTEVEKKQLIDYMEANKTFQYVSILGSALQDYGQWNEPLKMQKRRSDNKRQIAIVEHYLDVNMIIGFPTSMLDDVFKAGEDECDDDILEVPKADLLAKGVSEIDIDLYLAVRRLQFERVEHLLDKGANPENCFDGHSSAADFAHTEVECNLDAVYSLLSGESEFKDWSDELMLLEYAAYDRLLYLFKKYESNRYSSKDKEEYLWLKDLCNVYSHYIHCLPDKCDKIDFRFDYPDCGWIDMCFYKDGKTVNYVSFSDVYEPFDALKGWVEQIAKSRIANHQYACSVCIDCEGVNVILAYQPMWGYPVYQSEYGVLTIYDEAEGKMILEAYCKTDDFVKSFYGSLIGFCKETSTQVEFITAWLWDAYNGEMSKFADDSPEQNAILYNKMKSKIIKDYLKYSK